jgi:hypothetical protein
MATLTLRQTKNAPLTHVELDANFTALDSDIGAGRFDSGIVVNNGIVAGPLGDIDLQTGDLILRDGDILYNPRLTFYDLTATAETMRIDSNGSFLIGSSVNSQTVNLKVGRVGNQHTLFGSKVSNSGQTTRMELGPGGDGTETGAGLLATQATSNFNDWTLDLFVSNSTDGYVNAISIDQTGETTFNQKVIFSDSAEFSNGLNITGDLIVNGAPLGSAGTVSSVGQTVPNGFTVAGSPVTTAGILGIGYAPTHSAGLPSNTLQADWTEAYGWGDHSLEGYLKESDLTDGLSNIPDFVEDARLINTQNGIQGGGNLSADLTLSLDGTYTGDFDVTGNVRATQDVVAFYNTSDERAKTDISVIENALDKVSSLRGVQFEYKETGVRSTGLIAQELQEVLPEAVFVSDEDTGMLGVRYQITVGLLVEAIKELKAEIEELKK